MQTWFGATAPRSSELREVLASWEAPATLHSGPERLNIMLQQTPTAPWEARELKIESRSVSTTGHLC